VSMSAFAVNCDSDRKPWLLELPAHGKSDESES
jgi:hypothetical protein